MKLQKKNNVKFLEGGGCFLYFYDENPRCFLTNALIENEEVFDDIQEKSEFIKNDCQGNIKKCPYIPQLWDLEVPEEEGTPLLNLGNITIDFDYSFPQENLILTDALVIPSNTLLRFDDFIDFGQENNIILQKECKKRQLNFEIGDSIITHGANIGYPKIAHCILMKPGDLTIDIMAIGLALYNSLVKLEDEGCQSVSISPLVKIDRDLVLPNIDLYLKTCLTTILTFVSEYEIKNVTYILVHIPPNFISDLQGVIEEINNIE